MSACAVCCVYAVCCVHCVLCVCCVLCALCVVCAVCCVCVLCVVLCCVCVRACVRVWVHEVELINLTFAIEVGYKTVRLNSTNCILTSVSVRYYLLCGLK